MKFTLTGKQGAPTVLLSAGLGGAGAFWGPQLAMLEAHFQVLRFDHRGTGANMEVLPEHYSIRHMAEDALAVMDAAGIETAHVMGHALGGLVGLEIARCAPARLGRLVLVNAWAKADRHSERCFDIRIGILRAQGPAAYVAAQPLFLHTAPYLSANGDKIDAEIAHGTAHFQGADTILKRIAALRAFDLRDDLPAITAPTLVVAALDDLLVPYTASEALAAGLPNAELWLMPMGGHACCVEHPKSFNARVLEFLGA
jgi:aminoacrylate hydrolase